MHVFLFGLYTCQCSLNMCFKFIFFFLISSNQEKHTLKDDAYPPKCQVNSDLRPFREEQIMFYFHFFIVEHERNTFIVRHLGFHYTFFAEFETCFQLIGERRIMFLQT